MFTKAQFEKNEDNNYHTENGIEMAKHFGTEDEQKLMLQIQKDHYARGHINPDEIEARSGIVKKYWHMLESISEGVSDDEIAKHYRMLKLPSMKSWEKLVKMGLPKNKANESEADDLYHNNVKKVGQKNYNDYKGIQLHNLEKQLNQVFKTLLALTDIEDKDNSSDMVNDLRNMHGALSDLKDAHNNAFEKLNTGRHRKESTNEVAEHGSTEYYREQDKGQLNHTRSMLMKTAGQLEVAINQRHKFSKELMGTGDRAGTGDLYKMLETLNELIEKWDEKTELYGT